MSGPARAQVISDFIRACGWGGAQMAPLAGDASARRYARLMLGSKTAVLMDAEQQAKTPPCPLDATPEMRAALGYNAEARLAGASVRAFAALATELVARGFGAPKVLGADYDSGLMLLEDMGDNLFSAMADSQQVEAGALYGAAVDVLAALSRCSFDARLPAGRADWPVQSYDQTALLTEAGLLTQWYAPYRGHRPGAAALAQLGDLWVQAFAVLEALPPVLVLRDVHAENLLWMASREGLERTGLLDFQDALFGSPAYDLVSLLQDSRRTLPAELEETMKARFIERAKIRDRDAFASAYAVLGAQRAAKVLGIFVRLAERDGKRRYLAWLPIAARHFAQALEHQALTDINAWMRTHIPAVFTEGAS